MGELYDIDKANVALSALDAAHVVAVEISQLGQLFLRKSTV
jgi:hypothetical protein